MATVSAPKPTGYDKYINYRSFLVAVVLFAAILAVPLPDSMLDVAVEFSAGRSHVQNFFTKELFGKPYGQVEQWQALTARILEKSMVQGVTKHKTVLRRTRKQLQRLFLI